MDRAAYEVDICRRLHEARVIPFRLVLMSDVRPRVSECHQNVDAWVAAHPDCKAVRGWVTYACFSESSMGLTAHSVVQGPDGELFDITPLDREGLRDTMHFVRHSGDDASFAIERHRNLFMTCACSEGAHHEK
ncbi:hypothetical protein ACS0Y6_04025 [Burkholderia gladioli]|uniref:hypothetical protein n=1 Tax=Burkholderia gladioli TaxID=28095 RepID=UPI003F7A6FEE